METIILGTFLAHCTGIFAFAPFCSTSSQLAVSAHNQLSWGTTRRFRNSSTFSRAVVIMISFGGNIVVNAYSYQGDKDPSPQTSCNIRRPKRRTIRCSVPGLRYQNFPANQPAGYFRYFASR